MVFVLTRGVHHQVLLCKRMVFKYLHFSFLYKRSLPYNYHMLQLYYCTKNPSGAVLIMHNINFYSHTHTHMYVYFIESSTCAIKIVHVLIEAALDGFWCSNISVMDDGRDLVLMNESFCFNNCPSMHVYRMMMPHVLEIVAF